MCCCVINEPKRRFVYFMLEDRNNQLIGVCRSQFNWDRMKRGDPSRVGTERCQWRRGRGTEVGGGNQSNLKMNV